MKKTAYILLLALSCALMIGSSATALCNQTFTIWDGSGQSSLAAAPSAEFNELPCLTPDQTDAYLAQEMPLEEGLLAREHLASCPQCAANVVAAQRGQLMSTTTNYKINRPYQGFRTFNLASNDVNAEGTSSGNICTGDISFWQRTTYGKKTGFCRRSHMFFVTWNPPKTGSIRVNMDGVIKNGWWEIQRGVVVISPRITINTSWWHHGGQILNTNKPAPHSVLMGKPYDVQSGWVKVVKNCPVQIYFGLQCDLTSFGGATSASMNAKINSVSVDLKY